MPSVNARVLVLALLAVVLAVPAGAVAATGATPAAQHVQAAAKAKAKPLCRKLYYSRVMGQRPTYSRGLKHYPLRQFTCRAYWLAGADDSFVPQAVAVDGAVAYVSGYTWPADVQHNRCRIQKIDLLTGAVLADQSLFGGYQSDANASGSTTTNYQECRHGGGLALDAQGLWVSEAGRLWLMDPDKIGVQPTNPKYPVIRWWGLPAAPVRASTLVINNGAIGVGYYTSNKAQSVLSWFGEARILIPGYQTLTAAPANPVTDAAPYRQQPLPTQTQGMYWWKGHGGLLSTRGVGACSRIVYKGRQFGAIPGLEAIQISPDGSRAYLMSENTSRPFTGPGEHLVPFLTQVKTSDLLKLKGAGSCG